ncbi:MAG: O-acetylserine/cysteine efflux transporter [Oceanospirillaceae bacterium]|jgi:O-acetylserine/cysteine efflux transporter
MTNHPWKSLDMLALAVVLFGWGGNFIAIRYAVLDIPSWTALSLRLILVGCLLVFFLRNPLPHFKYYLFITLALVPGHFGLLFLASQLTTNVSAISLFIQLNPAFALLFGWLLLNEKPGMRRIVGLLMAFMAMVILFYEPNLLGISQALIVAAMSAMFMGLYSVLLRSMPKQIRPIDIIGWTAILGTPMIASIAYFTEGSPLETLTDVSSQSYLAVLYSAIVSSIISHGLWAWLCRRHPVAQVVPFSLLVPIIAISLAALFLGESITVQMLVAAGVLCLGLFIIAKAKR